MTIDWQKTAFMFPGQGSQEVGMGAEIAAHTPAAKAIYDQADEILGLAFSRLCFEGPEDELNDTYNTQPALYITCLAILAALKTDLGERQIQAAPHMIAGHSLGEITALVAAGAIDFPAGLRLVRERGRLMRAAGEQSPGAMAAIMGLDVEIVREICQDASQKFAKPLVVANDNCPGQLVISGDIEALDYALPITQEKGARRAVKLPISIAAHSPLMAHSAAEFRQVVESTPMILPTVPVVGNASAAVLPDERAIRDELSGQLMSPVRWTETIQLMVKQGITTFIEFGPKAVLKGLLKRIDRDATGISLEKSADIQALLQS